MLDKKELVIESVSTTVIDVMRAMNNAGSTLALIVGENEKLEGIVTDGDIRRAIVGGYSKEDPVQDMMNRTPLVVREDMDPTVMTKLLGDKFKYVPVLDDKGRIKGLVTYNDTSVAMDIRSRNVCVLGLGYVGLTLSLVMADVGFKVYGYDIDKELTKNLARGTLSFFEDGIDVYLNRHANKRFHPTSDLGSIDAGTYIITVGTPIDEMTKLPNIGYVEKAIESIAPFIGNGDLIILRSTVPVGTTRGVVLPILRDLNELEPGRDYSLAYAPERTIEGAALNEIRELPQIVGAYDQKSGLLTKQLFKELTNTIIEVEDLESAEMIKIMNNTFRDLKFAYANQMALVCKDLGLDMFKLVQSANMGYTRDTIPVPSPGVGGACLSKDPYILLYSARDIETKPTLTEASRQLNESIPGNIAEEIVESLALSTKDVSTVKIFVIGFAFKGQPETSDMRGSTTLDLLKHLSNLGVDWNRVFGYDPVIDPDEINRLGIKYSNLKEGFEGADVVIIMNNHRSYRKMDVFSLLESSAEDVLFVDGWHMFEPRDIVGIRKTSYLGVGCKYLQSVI